MTKPLLSLAGPLDQAVAGHQALQGHTCAVPTCHILIPHDRLMCGFHWRSVPQQLRRSVWHHYVPGQERTGTTSNQYRRAAAAAVASIVEKKERTS